MGGSATSTTPGGTFNPQAEVRPATQATAADIAAFDSSQAQNKRMTEGFLALGAGLGKSTEGLGSSRTESNAIQSQMQAEQYRKFMEMMQKNQANGLGFIPDMPFQLRNSGDESVYNAWEKAPSTLLNNAMPMITKAFSQQR